MIIEPFKHYQVTCRAENGITYLWNLIVLPSFKSWNIVNQHIDPHTVFCNYYILTIEDITNRQDFQFVTLLNEHEYEMNLMVPTAMELLDANEIEDINTNMYYSSSYNCHYCQSVVVNDVCTNCMIDWND